MEIDRHQITGLVLAGGRGSRMGGVDKGLLLHNGQPLALHAAQRLAPQVGALLLNANRHAARYAAFGWPVVADVVADVMADAVAGAMADAVADADADADAVADAAFAGPLAGMLAGLQHSSTPYLATVACDTPQFPADLVQRLAQALCDSGAPLAMAMSIDRNLPGAHATPQPVFCLLHAALRDSLAAALRAGQHKVRAWAQAQGCVPVLFDNADAFANANTPQQLHDLQAAAAPPPNT